MSIYSIGIGTVVGLLGYAYYKKDDEPKPGHMSTSRFCVIGAGVVSFAILLYSAADSHLQSSRQSINLQQETLDAARRANELAFEALPLSAQIAIQEKHQPSDN